jgi:hypothetical protein
MIRNETFCDSLKGATMEQITIRGIPKKVEKAIKEESKKEGKSLNKAIIALLEKAVGVEKKAQVQKLYHDLDHLAGKWSVNEASEFDTYLNDQRKIDEETWK